MHFEPLPIPVFEDAHPDLTAAFMHANTAWPQMYDVIGTQMALVAVRHHMEGTRLIGQTARSVPDGRELLPRVERAHEAANIPVPHADLPTGSLEFDVVTPSILVEIFRTGMNRALFVVNGFAEWNLDLIETTRLATGEKMLNEHPRQAALLLTMLEQCVDVFGSRRLLVAKKALHAGLRGLLNIEASDLRRETKHQLIGQASIELRAALEAEIPDRVLSQVMEVTGQQEWVARETIENFIMRATITQDADEINEENRRLREEEKAAEGTDS